MPSAATRLASIRPNALRMIYSFSKSPPRAFTPVINEKQVLTPCQRGGVFCGEISGPDGHGQGGSAGQGLLLSRGQGNARRLKGVHSSRSICTRTRTFATQV